MDAQIIAEVVAGWTGIPVGRMLASEMQTVLDLPRLLAQRVVGQDGALAAISRRIQTSRAGLKEAHKPIGVFLLAGPTGVGKTETALALAELLYGGEQNVITINMTEFGDAHTVSNLKGSSRGLVGYGEGGALTEPVRRRPHSVVLLDEMEKADKRVMELFYQVFDKGVLEDPEGNVANFSNTVILMTTNLGSATINDLCEDGDTCPDFSALARTVEKEVISHFGGGGEALVGRMVVVPFYPLDEEVLKKIVQLKVGKIRERLADSHHAELSFSERAVDFVLERCRAAQTGARMIDNIMTDTVLPNISGLILEALTESKKFERVSVDVDDDGELIHRIG